MKYCYKCKVTVETTNFYKNKSNKDGLDKLCKTCRTVVKKEYRLKPEAKEKERQNHKLWVKNNTALVTESARLYRERNKEHIRKQRKEYRACEKHKQRDYNKNKEWRKKNRLKLRAQETERIRNNPELRMRRSIRSRANRAIKRHIKYQNTPAKLAGSAWTDKGCTNSEYVHHIQSLWEPWMNWNNYGNGEHQWNVDHIIPLKAFDLSKKEDFRAANHFSNTRPIHARKNFKKGSKIEQEETDQQSPPA